MPRDVVEPAAGGANDLIAAPAVHEVHVRADRSVALQLDRVRGRVHDAIRAAAVQRRELDRPERVSARDGVAQVVAVREAVRHRVAILVDEVDVVGARRVGEGLHEQHAVDRREDRCDVGLLVRERLWLWRVVGHGLTGRERAAAHGDRRAAADVVGVELAREADRIRVLACDEADALVGDDDHVVEAAERQAADRRRGAGRVVADLIAGLERVATVERDRVGARVHLRGAVERAAEAELVRLHEVGAVARVAVRDAAAALAVDRQHVVLAAHDDRVGAIGVGRRAAQATDRRGAAACVVVLDGVAVLQAVADDGHGVVARVDARDVVVGCAGGVRQRAREERDGAASVDVRTRADVRADGR